MRGVEDSAMRRLRVAFAFLVLAVGPAVLRAQSGPVAASYETELFSGSDLLAGKRMTESECGPLPTAVWVVVQGQGDCVRYYHAAAGVRSELIVFLPGEVVSTNVRGEVRPH